MARRAAIEIHLETDLAPLEFKRLLGLLPADVFKVNYDTGNSASLGHSPADEFAAYGDRVGSVHIKDRRLAGGTVPLGLGSVDFVAVFRALARASYAGEYVLQVARGASGDEVQWAAENRRFVEAQLRRAVRRPDSWT
jgi:hexulose-6-phosphate isomerase